MDNDQIRSLSEPRSQTRVEANLEFGGEGPNLSRCGGVDWKHRSPVAVRSPCKSLNEWDRIVQYNDLDVMHLVLQDRQDRMGEVRRETRHDDTETERPAPFLGEALQRSSPPGSTKYKMKLTFLCVTGLQGTITIL